MGFIMRGFLKHFLVFIIILIALALCSDNTKASRPDISEYVEVELIIAVDTSGSITESEYRLQKEGVISAFRSKEFENFLARNKYGIAVIYMEWSGDNQQQYTRWHRIHTTYDVEVFLYDVGYMERVYQMSTAIHSAMLKSLELFDKNPYPGIRKVIDISGDGKNTWHESPNLASLIEARDKVLAKGITINGLPITVDTTSPDLEDYYNNYVIGGPSSFSLSAKSFSEYGAVFLRKLITEIG